MLACTRHSYVPKKPVCLSINSITCCRGFLAERGPALLDLCRGELLCMFSCSSTDCCIWRPVGTPCCPNCAYLSGCVLLGRQALRPSVFGSDLSGCVAWHRQHPLVSQSAVLVETQRAVHLSGKLASNVTPAQTW